MELIAIVFMLGAGAAVAGFALVAMSIASRGAGQQAVQPNQRDALAASILVQLVSAGGASFEEARRRVLRGSGLAAPVTGGIDVANWAESFASHSSRQQREELLERAVQLVAEREGPVPLRQYATLLDLSFGLGFHTDALARLRERYGFEYVDHAKAGRGGSAEKALYEAGSTEGKRLLALLELDGQPTRQQLSAAYRKMVTRHHPDRYHAATAEVRSDAAERFIEITRAYEALLALGGNEMEKSEIKD
jgi:transposase